MRRHWCVTLWLDADGRPLFDDEAEVFDLDNLITEITMTVRGLRGRYFCWSFEDSRLEDVDKPPSKSSVAARRAEARAELGGLHIHVYLETERTVRWSTVRNRFQQMWKGAHVENKRGWRDAAREYHMGLVKGDEKPSHITHGEWGEWLDEHLGVEAPHDYAEEAALMIVEGATPQDVARRFPRWFITKGAGVTRLWETLHGQRWFIK